MNQSLLTKPEKEFKVGNIKKYEVKAIVNSVVYIKEAANNEIIGFYYFVLWKSYLENKNI